MVMQRSPTPVTCDGAVMQMLTSFYMQISCLTLFKPPLPSGCTARNGFLTLVLVVSRPEEAVLANKRLLACQDL